MSVRLNQKFYTFVILIIFQIIINSAYAIKLNIQLTTYNDTDSSIIDELYKQLDIENLNKEDYKDWQAKYHIISTSKEITAFYETKGYYNTIVEKKEFKSDSLWDVRYIINKGPPTLITRLDIQVSGPGKKNTDIKKVIAKSNLKLGEKINYKDYDDLKNDLYATAENHGYFDATFTKSNIYINRDNNTAKVIVNFNTSEKYKYGNVSFEQQEFRRISEVFLFRFLNFKKDQKYSYQKILNLQVALSKYFSKVIIIPTPDKKKKTVNIKIVLQPFNKYKYKFGVGYSTDDGFRIVGSRKVLYLTQCGHSYEISGQAAQYNDYVNLIYYSPGKRPATDQISFGYNYLNEKKQTEKYLEKRRHETFVNYQRQYDQFNSRVVGGIRYNIENYTTVVEQNKINSRLLTPEFTWYKLYNNKDKFGYIINLNVLGSVNDLLSTISLFKSMLYSKVVYYITSNFKTSVRGQIGQIWNSDNNVSEIPPTMRFYAGGTDSVRGYRYKSIAPRYTTPEGKEYIVGGNKILVGSIEFALRVYGNWFAAVFSDAGNADNTWKLVKADISKSVGFGAHYQSPIGEIKVDVANALSKRGKPWRLNINLSSDI